MSLPANRFVVRQKGWLSQVIDLRTGRMVTQFGGPDASHRAYVRARFENEHHDGSPCLPGRPLTRSDR